MWTWSVREGGRGALELGGPRRKIHLGGDLEEVDGAVLEGEPLGRAPLALRVHPLYGPRGHEEALPERHPALPACMFCPC